MPCRPRKVEKLGNHRANPAGAPSHSSMSQKTRGSRPNKAASSIASDASTASARRSYAASSRTKAKTSPASPGHAERIETVIAPCRIAASHRDLRLDARMGIVAFEDEILVAEGEQVLGGRREPQGRQLARRPRELEPRLLEMVEVEVRIAERVDELARRQIGHLRDHQGEQRIGRDVERHAEKDVGGALVELTGEPAVDDVELEEAMARRQRHLVDVGRVPGGNDQAARIRIAPDHGDDVGDLVDLAAVGRRPRAPLLAVDRSELAALVRPFVPDGNAVVVEVLDVGVAGEEPEQLMDDRFDVQLLGGDERKALREDEAHLVAEHRQRAGAGAVALLQTGLEDAVDQVEIFAHGFPECRGTLSRAREVTSTAGTTRLPSGPIPPRARGGSAASRGSNSTARSSPP